MSKISQNFRKFGFSWKKNRWVFGKEVVFLKTAQTSKFAVKCDWNIPFSQSVENLVFYLKNMGFSKKIVLFKKTVKVANLL